MIDSARARYELPVVKQSSREHSTTDSTIFFYDWTIGLNVYHLGPKVSATFISTAPSRNKGNHAFCSHVELEKLHGCSRLEYFTEPQSNVQANEL